MNHRFVFATQNMHKLIELRHLFASLPITLLSPIEALGAAVNVPETGSTFEENALQKARVLADKTMMPVLADDSGLEVSILDGKPGVYSARFSGLHATDAENNQKLIQELEKTNHPASRLTPDGFPLFEAQFRSVLAFVDPLSSPAFVHTEEGLCKGFVTSKPKGTSGFGYDPLFLLEKEKNAFVHFAELSLEEKNKVSHRAKAAFQMKQFLLSYVEKKEAELSRISLLPNLH